MSGPGKDDWTPEDDPFACSRCGCYLSEGQRVSGENYCRDCRSEGG